MGVKAKPSWGHAGPNKDRKEMREPASMGWKELGKYAWDCILECLIKRIRTKDCKRGYLLNPEIQDLTTIAKIPRGSVNSLTG